MNSCEILQALRHINARHAGIYPADRVPRVEHWVAFFLDEHGSATYFDSYEIPPVHPGFLLRLRRNSIIHGWNTRQLQGIFSQTYGHYSCVFLYYMCNGYNLNRFLSLFTEDCEHNDRLIVRLFHKIFLFFTKKETNDLYAMRCYV
ncbi:hypothetical protein ACFW04_013004 [Cataglyphis niger]